MAFSKRCYMRKNSRRTKILGILIAQVGFAGLFFSALPARSSNPPDVAFALAPQIESVTGEGDGSEMSSATSLPQPAKKDYSKFTHASHDGSVTVLGSKQKVELKCGTCHAVTKENPDPTT